MTIFSKSISTIHPFWEEKQKWIKFLLKIFSFKFIFLLPQIYKTMLVSDKFVNFNIIFRNQINYSDQQLINKIFYIINDKFYIRKKKILNDLRFKFYLIKNFAKKIKDKKIIIYEVGAGLGFQAIINSFLLNPSKIIIYDLPVISSIQKRIFSICNVKGIIHNKKKIDHSIKNFFFFSSWGFSEIPIIARRKFEYLITNKSSYVLIYFQKIFLVNNDLLLAIDNIKYFIKLKKKMEKKNYIVSIKKESSISSKNHYKFMAIKKN
jgi:hypothetical protein